MVTQTLPLDESTRLRAIGLMCAAVALFALLDATAKYAVTVAAIPLFQLVWMRFLSHVVLNAAIFGPRTFFRALKANKPMQQLLRGFFLFGSTAFNFAALQYLQLDESATILFLTPLLVAVLAGPLLDEWIGWRRLIAVLVGFSGVLLVLRPGLGGIHWAAIYSFGATACYALYTLHTRYLARYDPSSVTQIYSPIAGVIAMAPLGISVWTWPQDVSAWILMIATGVFGGVGHYLLILAHRRAPAPLLAPFSYVNLIFQVVLGYLVFSEIPSVWTAAGCAVIVASGLYLLHRERSVEKAGSATASLSSDSR